jgi:actin-related protein
MASPALKAHREKVKLERKLRNQLKNQKEKELQRKREELKLKEKLKLEMEKKQKEIEEKKIQSEKNIIAKSESDTQNQPEISNTTKIIGYILIGFFCIIISVFIYSVFFRRTQPSQLTQPLQIPQPQPYIMPQHMPQIMTGGSKRIKSFLKSFKSFRKYLINLF